MFDYDSLHLAISELRSKQIFFIGGAVKSGTTWLQLLLDSHPDVSCNGEGHLANNFAPLLQRALDEQSEYISEKNASIFEELPGYPGFNETHFRYLLASAITLLLHEQAKHKSARAIGEKTPDNIRFLDLLDTMFPTAKMIQIVRDGRDCAVSGWFHNLRVSPEWTRENYASMDDYVREFAEIWRNAVGEGSAFGMRHPTRYLALRYEDLSADPEATLEGVFRFLGVECNRSIVRTCCAAGSFEKVSGGRSRGQENRQSFFRKGSLGDWRNHLSDEANRTFEERAGEWLTRFGYSRTSSDRGAVEAKLSPAMAFENALSLHQQGKLREAERLYRVVLKSDRHDFHSLLNLGVIRAQQERFEDAIRLFERVIAQFPNSADAHYNLGNAFMGLKDQAAAIPHFEMALAIKPDHVAARNNLRLLLLARNTDAVARCEEMVGRDPQSAKAQIALGNALQEAGRGEEAIACFERALAVVPGDATAHYNIGNVLQDLSRYEEAIERYGRALTLNPGYAEAYNNLGNAYLGLNRCDDAIASYGRALEVKTDYPEAHNNLGTALCRLGRYEEAILSYERVLAIKADDADAHYNLGIAFDGMKRHEEAIVSYERALEINPGHCEAHNNLGRVLKELDRCEDAISSYRRALAINPGYAEAHNNLGNALVEVNRCDEAIASLERALAIKPAYAEAHCNFGNALLRLNRHHEAIASYERALAIKPDDAETNWDESLAHLALGDLADGWRKYEWRWRYEKLHMQKRDCPQPLWLGKEDLSGKTILLHFEQGFGDVIQFARYVPLVARRGARVILEVQRPLLALLESLQGASFVGAEGDPLPSFDYHCPLMSLPLAFETTLETIPAEIPYLLPSADKMSRWREQVPHSSKPLIGLAWAGRPTHKGDHERSISLARLLPLLDVPGAEFVALQKDLREGDIERLRAVTGITVLGDRLEDFSDTAAIISMLDLVITVDTSVAHLAGALGRPTWILLPFSAEWRWLRNRDDSPWYPTARLFRQPRDGDWESVVARICRELQAFDAGQGIPASAATR